MYYGWYIVFAGVIMMACNSSIGIYGFTAFIDPLALTLGWSYAHISLASSLRGIETGALNPLMGALVDRYPAKALALIGTILYGFGLICLSRVNTLITFYVSFLIMGLGSSLGFSMVPQTTVARWFEKDMGKATGTLFLGNGIGGFFVPALVYLIDVLGWRKTLVISGAGLLLIGLPLCMVFRSSPGRPTSSKDARIGPDSQAPPEVSQRGKSVKEALGMRAFWQIGLGTFFQILPVSSVITHIMPYLRSLNVARSTGGLVAMGVPLVSLLARIPFGWLSDVYDKRTMRVISIGFVTAGLFVLWMIRDPSPVLILLYILFMGLGVGGVMPTLLPTYRAYFGVRNFGKILGLINLFFTMGAIAGPPIAGMFYDAFGSFESIWLIFSAATILGAIITITAPPVP